jgi:putative membrane protein
MRFVITWLCNVAALYVAALLLHGITYGDDWWTLVIAGGVFSLVNMLVKPFVTVLSLPLIILTLGVAMFFVNLLMLLLTAWIVRDFDVDGFWAAVGGTLVIWAVNLILGAAFDQEESARAARQRRRRYQAYR